MDLSIVIVSYNVKDFLRGAIASARRSLVAGHLDGEIMVVDNNSADGSVTMIRNEFPDVALYPLEENLGFGRANNVALREAKGDYILLLNPDTILGEDTLGTMVNFMREHPEAGLSGCKLLNSDGTFQLSCRRGFPTPWASFTKLFGLARLLPNSRLFARYNLTYLPVDETYEVDALGGAFMMLSRSALQATQGFDEDYFMYGEDLDLCFRVKKAGYKVFYVPTTATIHFKGESTKRSAVNEVQLFYEAMHVFVKKHYRASFLFNVLLRMGISLRSIIAVLIKNWNSISLFFLDYIVIALSVLVGSQLRFGAWFGLPEEDYPYALIIPPAIVVLLLAIFKAYRPIQKSSVRPVLIAVPAILIGLSSLTYFFKEFPASRSFVIVVTFAMSAMLLIERSTIKLLGRILHGFGTSITPAKPRALIVGADEEALRIASLLTRTEFLRRFEVLGLIDQSLDRLGKEIQHGLKILGDPNMVGKIVREQRVAEVIFSSTISYTEVLAIMQRTSAENLSKRVNFSMVPAASDVLLGKQSIEILSEHSGESLALLPVENNLDRFSHRCAKRLLDIGISALIVPVAALSSLINPSEFHKERKNIWMDILLGRRTLVGVEDRSDREAYYQKPGLTSLAAVTAKGDWHEEDIRQFDHYYARNHTIGMDCEILLKAMFLKPSPNISERSA